MTEYVLDHNRATEAQIICDGTKESLAESENGHFEEQIEGEPKISVDSLIENKIFCRLKLIFFY